MSDYNAQELLEETTIEDIQEWLESCEANIEVGLHRGGTAFTERERDFLDSVRLQFDERVKQGSARPLTGKQLVWLRTIYDRT